MIEFKMPGRDNYNGNDNPIRQVSDYVQKLRGGKLASARGRVAPVRLRDAAYHCYIIADRNRQFSLQTAFADGGSFVGGAYALLLRLARPAMRALAPQSFPIGFSPANPSRAVRSEISATMGLARSPVV